MSRHWVRPETNATFETRVRYFVEVCRFTFQFQTLNRVQEYLEFFSAKTHPSSRRDVRAQVREDLQDIADRARSRGVVITEPYGHIAASMRRDLRRFIRSERGVIQSEFERLPMYLLKNKNRLRIVKALETALNVWTS